MLRFKLFCVSKRGHWPSATILFFLKLNHILKTRADFLFWVILFYHFIPSDAFVTPRMFEDRKAFNKYCVKCVTNNCVHLSFECWHWMTRHVIVRRAGLLWSQQDFEWRWSVPLFKCLTVLEFSFILFDLCLLITFFFFFKNYVPIVTFGIFTYYKIWILSIMFCFIWSYWIIYFLACLEVSWRVVS